MQKFLEHITDAVIALDKDWRYTYVNQQAAEILHRSKEDLLGKHIWTEFPEMVGLPLYNACHKAAEYQIALSIEEHYAPLDRWFENQIYPSSDGVCVFSQNITLRKQAEQTLEENERRYRTIIDVALDAVVSIDTHGQIRDWNPQAEKTFGWSKSEMIGQKLIDTIIPPQFRDAHEQGMHRYLATGEENVLSQRIEITALRRNGEEFPIELAITPVRYQDVVEFTAFIRDITKRKQDEESLRRHADELAAARDDIEKKARELTIKAHELEQARAAAEAAAYLKGEFLANMSHEIRTPMTVVLGYTDVLLEEGSIKHLSPDKISTIQTIQRNGQHLLKIINDILDLSKIEAGKMNIENIACSPHRVVLETISLMRHRTTEKGLALGVEFIGPIPETIHTDPTRLMQILINLLGNAIKFTTDGGIRVIIKMMNDPDMSNSMSFEVIDTGIGLTQEQQQNLFQAFSQADTSITRQFGGTGLGLVITKRLAKMLGGDVSVTSTYQEGAFFRVTINTGSLEGVPMMKDPNSPASIAGSVSATTKTKIQTLHGRILLAEDGPDNQKLISLILKKSGADVTIAADGQIAFDKAMEAWQMGEPFDAILMDMQMPELDGYGSTRKLRQEGYKGPIIALTAHAMTEDRKKCIEAGCDDYATKPIDRAELIAMIARHIQQQAQPVSGIRQEAATTHGGLQDSVRALSSYVEAIQESLAAKDFDKIQSLAKKLELDAAEKCIGQIVEYAKALQQTARTTHDLSILDATVQQLAKLCNSAYSNQLMK